ncbi:MAG: hypothetical protein KIS62_15005 [Ramlibacter sp.]|nr:hypothetical protein [Ramlibacter sp.]
MLPALGNRRMLERVQSALSHLPLVSGGGLEVRLAGGPSRPIDLALHATAAGGIMDLLARGQVTREAPLDDAAAAAWQRLRAFAEQHRAAGSLLREAVPQAWFEFDLDADDRLPPPNFFVRLDDPFSNPPILGPMALARQQAAHQLMRRALQPLGVEPSPKALEALALCLRHRPGSASVRFLGVMLARPGRGFRLALSDLPLSELTAYLRDIGWPGDHRPLVPLLYFIEQHVDRVALQLDITDDGVQARLGLELAFGRAREPRELPEAQWTRLLEALQGLALCEPAKARAVQAWPGLVRKIDQPDQWPAGFSARQAWLRRSINHIKLTYEPTPDMPVPEGELGPSPLTYLVVHRIVTAKAYLAFNHPEA